GAKKAIVTASLYSAVNRRAGLTPPTARLLSGSTSLGGCESSILGRKRQMLDARLPKLGYSRSFCVVCLNGKYWPRFVPARKRRPLMNALNAARINRRNVLAVFAAAAVLSLGTAARATPANDLFVASFSAGNVTRLNGSTGTPVYVSPTGT